jgi:hypothetical protein
MVCPRMVVHVYIPGTREAIARGLSLSFKAIPGWTVRPCFKDFKKNFFQKE